MSLTSTNINTPVYGGKITSFGLLFIHSATCAQVACRSALLILSPWTSFSWRCSPDARGVNFSTRAGGTVHCWITDINLQTNFAFVYIFSPFLHTNSIQFYADFPEVIPEKLVRNVWPESKNLTPLKTKICDFTNSTYDLCLTLKSKHFSFQICIPI